MSSERKQKWRIQKHFSHRTARSGQPMARWPAPAPSSRCPKVRATPTASAASPTAQLCSSPSTVPLTAYTTRMARRQERRSSTRFRCSCWPVTGTPFSRSPSTSRRCAVVRSSSMPASVRPATFCRPPMAPRPARVCSPMSTRLASRRLAPGAPYSKQTTSFGERTERPPARCPSRPCRRATSRRSARPAPPSPAPVKPYSPAPTAARPNSI